MTPSEQTGAIPELEAFYEGFWRERSDGPPPRDERDRWAAIRPLVISALERAAASGPQGGRPRILDLGCGRGWLTRLLAETVREADVLGVDPLAASVEAARREHPGLPFRQGTGVDLLASGHAQAFDLVVSSEVIEHVAHPDQPAFLRQAFELLRPGGRLLLTTPRGELWQRWRIGGGRPQPVEAWLTEGDLARLARGAGFALVERSRAHAPSRPLTWQGWLDKWVLGRRFVRDLPLGWLRRRLRYAASLYQVAVLERPSIGASAAPGGCIDG